MRLPLLFLLGISAAIAHDFHLFLAISCEPACVMIIRHREKEEFYMSRSRPNKISRHYDEPVPEVNFKIDYFQNLTDFETATYEFSWSSHQNKSVYFKKDGISVIGHYFCPEDRCQVDNAKHDYRKQVNRWCFGLIFSGIFFFMLLSGAGEELYKFLRRGFRGPDKKSPINYDQLVLSVKDGEQPKI